MDYSKPRCPDPDCIDGKIVVYNAYNKDPLRGEEQDCDLCNTQEQLCEFNSPKSEEIN